jgi:hypothetical protein
LVEAPAEFPCVLANGRRVVSRSARFGAGRDAETVLWLGAGADIIDLQPHKVAAPQLAIDRELKEGEVGLSMRELKPHPNCPNVLRL